MAKVTWGVSGAEVDETERGDDFESYDGPVPPAGIYRLVVKTAEYTKFSTNSKGIKFLWLIDDNRPDKKRYNGAPVWDNLVVLESTAFKIAQFCDAIGAEGKDWDATQVDKDNNVTKIGRIKIDGLHVKARLKRGKNNEGEPRPEIGRYLALSDAADDAAGSGDDDGEEEAPF